MKEICLRNDALTVTIDPMGAELTSVRDANGVDRLWNGDPAYWPHHAPVLFPVAGGLRDLTYRLDGVSYTLEKHGFVSGRLFTVDAVDATTASLSLSSASAPSPGFPFDYVFRVRFALEGNALRVAFITENHGAETFYFSCGAHEAYACPEGIDAYELVFEKPEALRHSVLEGSLLSGETVPVPVQNGVLPLNASLFTNDSLVFSGHTSRSVTLRSRLHPRTVRVDFADFPYLLLWTMPGAGYLCIEPWHNLPDFTDSNGDITKKPGMIALQPGETRTLEHTITFG